MLSKLFHQASKAAGSRLRSAAIVGMPRRSVSLLINDQGLEEDQKLIQKTAYDFAD